MPTRNNSFRALQTTVILCPKCGKPMVHRVIKPGKGGKGGYDFWGCSGWPECRG